MLAQSELLIETSKLVHNWQFFKRFQPGCQMIPVLKSDAYGHGLLDSAKALENAGANLLAVFNLEEAELLRRAGSNSELWVLEGGLPDDIAEAGKLRLTMACWSLEQAKAMAKQAQKNDCRYRIHVKIDTGMSRLGFLPAQIPEFLRFLSTAPELELAGCFSHLAISAEPQHPLTLSQLRNFRQALTMLPASCHERHLCASNGILNRLAPDLPFARLGIGLYGYSELPEFASQLRLAMTFRSKVISIRELPAGSLVSYNGTYQMPQAGRLAVVPVGYADGYPRALSNQAEVLIRGRRLPVRGRVCMGMLMVDAEQMPDLQAGEEVVLLGHQGAECINADELAAKTNTIPHEILCNLGKHPNRIIK